MRTDETTARPKEQPRLCLCVSLFRPAIGGAERQAEQLARSLAARGHRVTVLTQRLPGTVTDERLYRRGELNDLVRRAGVRVKESFVYGDVPTAFARNLERLLPGVIYRRLKHTCTYGMGICCVGESR